MAPKLRYVMPAQKIEPALQIHQAIPNPLPGPFLTSVGIPVDRMP
jgi:hypothetical protein